MDLFSRARRTYLVNSMCSITESMLVRSPSHSTGRSHDSWMCKNRRNRGCDDIERWLLMLRVNDGRREGVLHPFVLPPLVPTPTPFISSPLISPPPLMPPSLILTQPPSLSNRDHNSDVEGISIIITPPGPPTPPAPLFEPSAPPIS